MNWTSPAFSLVALQPGPATQINMPQTRLNYASYLAEWGEERATRTLHQDLADWIKEATHDLTTDGAALQERLAYQAVMVGIG
jgi:hypothetical protein